jgi:hypothetical protein
MDHLPRHVAHEHMHSDIVSLVDDYDPTGRRFHVSSSDGVMPTECFMGNDKQKKASAKRSSGLTSRIFAVAAAASSCSEIENCGRIGTRRQQRGSQAVAGARRQLGHCRPYGPSASPHRRFSFLPGWRPALTLTVAKLTVVFFCIFSIFIFYCFHFWLFILLFCNVLTFLNIHSTEHPIINHSS